MNDSCFNIDVMLSIVVLSFFIIIIWLVLYDSVNTIKESTTFVKDVLKLCDTIVETKINSNIRKEERPSHHLPSLQNIKIKCLYCGRPAEFFYYSIPEEIDTKSETSNSSYNGPDTTRDDGLE